MNKVLDKRILKHTEPTRSVIANGNSRRCKCEEGMSNKAVHVAMAITMIFISTTILARKERKSKELYINHSYS